MIETKRFINFNYNGIPNVVQCKREEPMISICKKFCEKIGGDIDDFTFKYDNKEVNFELSFHEQANKRDKINSLMYVNVDKK